MESLRNVVRRRRDNDEVTTLWALTDVSFDVAPGEVVGVIGRNGAGKSTLLKILTRITEPTRGRIELFGRVGSLLEVGTGFHGELTGRENIFLNGAILGMRHREIQRRFDEIVDFAEIERFLDTPLKRYSSGMWMRLAFAVAAHMDPQILLVDEVLAVGDAAFQQKCVRKMRNVAGEGRTVLFVSHNFEAVASLCSRCILLQRGKVIMDGPPQPTIEMALAQYQMPAPEQFTLQVLRRNDVPRPRAIHIHGTESAPEAPIRHDDVVVATLHLDRPVAEGHTLAFQVLTPAGITLFNSFYRDDPSNVPLVAGRTTAVTVRLPAHLLPGGSYEAVFAYMLPNAETFWLARDVWFEVQDVGSGRNEGMTARRAGLVSVVLPWEAS
jgi:lipopolysaccharide transport system ATP-binding protein